MALLAGIDFSTRQIDAAIISLDDAARDMPPPTFRTVQLEQDGDRLRSVHEATRRILAPVGTPIAVYEVSSVWVEEPYGRYRTADRALLPIYGAILASIPGDTAAAGISTLEWRRSLGLPTRLSKADAITQAAHYLNSAGYHADAAVPWPVTDHLAEALLVALAGRTLTWRAAS